MVTKYILCASLSAGSSPNGQNDISTFEMFRELGVSTRTPSHLLCALLFSVSQEHVERIREDYPGRTKLRNEGASLKVRTTTPYYFDVLHFELGVRPFSRRGREWVDAVHTPC
jgi:hypothetical protein